MRASEIRTRFLQFFERQDHVVRPSSTLVPGDDPTLLFTNAGMVPFKKVFLGMEEPPEGRRRATTSQKCVRAGGKHNDLEQVGHTARHHTFFEMLGNFSFGDYFKRDAIRFAWEFVTEDLGIAREHLRVSVFETDDEARALWHEVAGLPDSRIYGLGAKDNFWQMADTGPCGPCTEIYVDLAHLAQDFVFPGDASGEWTDRSREEFSTEAFVEGAEAGRFLEIWNLVFMQFDRQPDGTLVPLPKPSVDTGAGLERIAAVMQGKANNFDTDVFEPLLARAEAIVGQDRRAGGHLASFRVIADHARAVSFLLADGVHPSNEGRGYVLRRILRRAVRHAYLLGRREPTLASVVETVIETMGDTYPELRQRAQHLVTTTRAEEERFLATIEGGLARFDELAPQRSTQGSVALRGEISGEDAFRLYDTFGFPIDLTELMARERGYRVDIAGFEQALERQRALSQEERRSRNLGVAADALADLASWERDAAAAELGGAFVGYDRVSVSTRVAAVRHLDGDRVAVLLEESPFYAESGGQVSDHGEILGEGWKVDVDEVRKVDGRVAAVGRLQGALRFGPAQARVPSERRRDTERNHTATHLLHAALREVLGEHVHQAGSVVEPDRLRFDFTHHGPVRPEQLEEVEAKVNRGVWAAVPVTTTQRPYQEAIASGAMALFGEKYGDVVRVVEIPGLSVELCGGTHVRNTSEIGLFRVVQETGVAAGVRRVTALTGPKAYEFLRDRERELARVAESVKAPLDQAVRRVQALVEERRTLERRIEEARRGGGATQVQTLAAAARPLGTAQLVATEVQVEDVKALQALGDALREQLPGTIAVLGARLDEGKATMLAVVSDDLRERGVRADEVVRRVAAAAGGKGGGKPHMAQAGIPDASRLGAALALAATLVGPLVGAP
ncbi:alanine--tRNA ligase [Roseisolibacter sp. H3M3-2]|uniref:alanine--tRNA ligase n=1 Tax=Roseisolibacter sp. H3M3-2 TaxID=3031323 RepID=UPI0023DBA2B3|nr:alanine--tRNA ligase [Roseisolibacter sp. H3M3-2]MDF1505009.1 alanine--tRNA ligase [Roseisolibacter sp. H3M3-2]